MRLSLVCAVHSPFCPHPHTLVILSSAALAWSAPVAPACTPSVNPCHFHTLPNWNLFSSQTTLPVFRSSVIAHPVWHKPALPNLTGLKFLLVQGSHHTLHLSVYLSHFFPGEMGSVRMRGDKLSGRGEWRLFVWGLTHRELLFLTAPLHSSRVGVAGQVELYCSFFFFLLLSLLSFSSTDNICKEYVEWLKASR